MKKDDVFISNRSLVISRIIIDREFDIPVDIYDEIDDFVVFRLVTSMQGQRLIENQYKTNESLQNFFKFIRSTLKISTVLFNTLNTEPNPIFRYLVFNESDWKKYIKISTQCNLEIIIGNNIIPVINEPMFHDTIELIIGILRNAIKVDNKTFINLMQPFFQNKNIRYMVRIAYMIGCDNSYTDTLFCLESGIPILYKNGSPSTIFMYLETVIDSKYNGLLDPSIVEQLSMYANNDDIEFNEMVEMLFTIGTTLNHKNLKYYYIVGKYTASEKALIGNLSVVKMESSCKINNFKEIIQIIGKTNSEISTNLQKIFLESGGDIESMFDENMRLLPEVSIFKLNDQLSGLLSILSIDQIRFLLLNCPEFTKNIMVSGSFSIPEYIKIAKSLLVYPVDTELYDILNSEKLSVAVDYRDYIINMIISGLTKEALFKFVPESMAYIEPSVSYIVDNLTYETVKFVPIHRIVHSIKQIIARGNGYQRFNLYENGNYISILTAVDNDVQFMINEIAKSGRYGYICDLLLDNTSEIIDILAKIKMKEVS